MKTVKATAHGFYKFERMIGEVFEVEDHKSSSWYVEVDAPVAPAPAKKEEPMPGSSFSQMAKSQPTSFVEHVSKKK